MISTNEDYIQGSSGDYSSEERHRVLSGPVAGTMTFTGNHVEESKFIEEEEPIEIENDDTRLAKKRLELLQGPNAVRKQLFPASVKTTSCFFWKQKVIFFK